MDRSALFANTPEGVTFRIGQPTGYARALARWYRLDDRRLAGRAIRIRHDGRWYTAASFEVRAVDRHGRGEGQPRHARAIPVPFRATNVGNAPAPVSAGIRLDRRLFAA